ncbi:MAG TPA: SDR family NAD(P)-dependent oxidoreductase, partial [Gaiella sp.]
MSDLSGRVVAITGASSGIGEATALACARAGATVALAARRADRLEAVAERIRGEGGRVETRVTDVADEGQARGFVEEAHARHGRLDVLVNNAGVMHLGRIEGAPLEEWRRMIDVNVLGVLYCTHTALPLMLRQGSGDIVMVSSVGGRVTPPLSGVYCLTKWGIGAFAEVLRKETVGTGVRVILIEPGRVETELRTHVRPEVLEELGPAFASLVGVDADVIA